ncbi:unnamed protein product [Bemisia tabaci]|uniref:Uncharacterized protein n=1 Tax=Bemisia tabaci TaxID=7038 RepID=A0A9P0F2J9_BEMTA|nr:unnamed protein product [Bemisia tabaci]
MTLRTEHMMRKLVRRRSIESGVRRTGLLVPMLLLHEAMLVVAPGSFHKVISRKIFKKGSLSNSGSKGSVRKTASSVCSLSREGSFRSDISTNSMKRYPALEYKHFKSHNWVDMSSFEIEKGDIVACLLSGRILGSFIRIPHWLMAINDRELMHVANPPKTNYVGAIEIVKKEATNLGYNTEKCLNLGSGGYDGVKAVERAFRWWRHVVYYHGLSCSCQHWVFYWVTGKPGGSFRDFPYFPVGKSCKLYKISANEDPGDPLWIHIEYTTLFGVRYWKNSRPATEEEHEQNKREEEKDYQRAITGIPSKSKSSREGSVDVSRSLSDPSKPRLARNMGRRSGYHDKK